MTSHASHFFSSLRGRLAALAVVLFVAGLLGHAAFAAEHAKTEAKVEHKAEAAHEGHGHTHGPAGHPTLAKIGRAHV